MTPKRWIRDARSLSDFIGYVVIYAPDGFPEEDYLQPHEQMTLERAFDELKTHTCERAEALRNKAPRRVAQELWGLLLAYNLVRLVMSRAAPRSR